jgi:hypothetical protein
MKMAVSRPNLNLAKGFAFPMAASVFAGAATMFVPTPMLESFTGATGLSEIFPATAAPLGDTARALIAFSTGALTMAVTAILSNRKGPKNMAAHQFKPVFTDNVEEASPSLAAKIKERFSDLGKISLPNMPWRKAVDAKADIRDLGDLPKLRTADSHPDAAPRRPFSAELDLSSVATEVEAPMPTPAADFWKDEAQSNAPQKSALPVSEAFHAKLMPEQIPETVPMMAPAAATASLQPSAQQPAPIQPEVVQTYTSAAPVKESATVAVAADPSSPIPLADLVAQLEKAVQQRQLILDQIAAAQDQIIATQSAAAHASAMAEPIATPASVQPVAADPVVNESAAPASHNDGYVPPYFDRPPLEAVPMEAKPVDDNGEEDEALRAALATLRRMNSQAG